MTRFLTGANTVHGVRLGEVGDRAQRELAASAVVPRRHAVQAEGRAGRHASEVEVAVLVGDERERAGEGLAVVAEGDPEDR